MIDIAVQWNLKNHRQIRFIEKEAIVCEDSSSTQPVPYNIINNINNNNSQIESVRENNLEENISCGKCDKIIEQSNKIHGHRVSNNNDNNVQSSSSVQTEKRKRRLKNKSQSLINNTYNNNVNIWRTKISLQERGACDLSNKLPVCFHISVLVFLWCFNLDLIAAAASTNTTTISTKSQNNEHLTSVLGSYIDDEQSVLHDAITTDDGDAVNGQYTHTWAVHIPNGDDNDLANIVARDHGFLNMGKIFDDHYHFVHNRMVKRSLTPAHSHQSRLENDNRVFWSQQQKAKSRRKRDFVRTRASRTSSRALSLVDAMPFVDPKWPTMWYLNRGGGLDMNVIPAWKEGITGKGIVVTILDDGLESDHPDIKDNYDPLASYDVNSHDDDPMPHYDMTDSNRHGTRCAGEVAATANNSFCAVGIAFGASVGGVRMLDGDVTDAVEARSLSHNMHHVDIYSASWGPDDDGKTVDGPGELASRAFIEGVTKGRRGKGSIFIWASGNGGRELDNCNCDGYTNSIWTLSISSATEQGHVPWYSEKCSSTLATTYSSGGQNEKQVVTTDLHHTCTLSHTGTSASAPLAAGIAALVLESNPNLTWRDLQHIVVRTAKPANLKDPTWSLNGVGRRISHSFGYGLMDAAAMVRVARTWKTVPEQQRCEINAPHVDKVIPPKSYIRLQLTVKHCESVNFLEHVQAKISLTTQRRGDIQLYLKSPAGTRVTLLTSRNHDTSRTGFNQWPFMSVHTWGESPHGNWQLEIHNEGKYMGQAFLRDWSLIFYGTTLAIDPNDRTSEPRSNSAEITTPNSSTTIGKSTTNLHQVYSPLYPRISANNFGNSPVKPETNKAYRPFGDISGLVGNSKKTFPKIQNKPQLAATQEPKKNNNNNNNTKNVDGKLCSSNTSSECLNPYKNNKGGSGKSSGGGGGGGKKDKTLKEPNSKNNSNSNKNKFYRKLQHQENQKPSQQQQQTNQQQQQQRYQKPNNKLKVKSKIQYIESMNSYEDSNSPVIGDLPLSYETFLTAKTNANVPSAAVKTNGKVIAAKATKHVSASPAIQKSSSLVMATIVGSVGNNRQQIPKLFERYEKIQAIFPELQPYHHVPREKLAVDKRKPNNANGSSYRTLLPGSNDTSEAVSIERKIVIGDILGGSKPLRENARKPSDSFMPDQRILKKQQLLLAAAGLSDSIQRPIALLSNEKNTNAQITQWDLVFYGTKAPPDQNNPYGNDVEQNAIETDASGQWHNMQQTGESSVIANDITNKSCLQTTTDQRCLACAPPTYLFNGHCLAECPSHTYPTETQIQQLHALQQADLNLNVLSNTIEEQRSVDGQKEPLTSPRECNICDESCNTCYGPLNSQCSSCYAGSQLRKQVQSKENYCFVLAERSSGQYAGTNMEGSSKTQAPETSPWHYFGSISGVAQLLLVLVPTLVFSVMLVLLVAKCYLRPKTVIDHSVSRTAVLYKRNNYDRVSLFPFKNDANSEEEKLFMAPNVEIEEHLENISTTERDQHKFIPMHIGPDCETP